MSLDVDLVIKEEPCRCCGRGGGERYVYDANITHNLHAMAIEAGIGAHVWCPENLSIQQAKDLVQPLERGITLMESDPSRFRKLQPANQWGTYEDFLLWLKEYLQACREFPEAFIRVSR